MDWVIIEWVLSLDLVMDFKDCKALDDDDV